MRTVIYARKSTMKSGQNDTIENQVKICRRRAKELGLDIVDVKKDTASGRSDDGREEVKDLIKGALNGEYECVIMKGISRFYRDVEQGLSLVKKLDRSNVRVITVEENFDSLERRSANGQLDTSMLTIYLMFAESESKKTAERIKHTQMEKAFAGEWNHVSSVPYGYTYDPATKKLKPNITTAPVIRMMFELYVDGLSMRGIARYLNGENPDNKIYLTSKNKQWSESTVGFILKNSVYIGDVVFNKRSLSSKPYQNPTAHLKTEDDICTRAHFNDKSEWIITKNAHEPIIDESLFLRVQQAINTKARRKGVRANTSLLAGLAKCGKCGKSMTFKKAAPNKGKDKYYCVNYSRFGTAVCDSHNMRAEDLESAILNDLKLHLQKLLDPNVIMQGLEGRDTRLNNIKMKISKIERELSNLMTKSDSLLDKNLSGDISDIQFKTLNERYIKESEILNDELIDYKARLLEFESEKFQKDYLAKIYEDLINIDEYPLEKKRLLLFDLIDKVEVKDKVVTIEYKF